MASGELDLGVSLPLLDGRFRVERLITKSTFAQLVLATDVGAKRSLSAREDVCAKKKRKYNLFHQKREKKFRSHDHSSSQEKSYSRDDDFERKYDRDERELVNEEEKSRSKEEDVNGKSTRQVALKILNAKWAHVGAQESAYLLSIKKIDPLGVSPIVRLIKAFRFGNHVCLAMEFLGPPLSQRLKKGKAYSLNEIRQIACDLLGALSVLHSHAGIIHADLKPENMCMCSEASGMTESFAANASRVKLIDFGNAMHFSDAVRYGKTFEVQTFAYRAPEVLFGVDFGPSIDIWSLGCIFAELRSGRPLFPVNKPQKLLFAMLNILGPIPKGTFDKGSFFPPLQFQVDRLFKLHPEVKKMLPDTHKKRIKKLAQQLNCSVDLGEHEADEWPSTESMMECEFIDFLLGLLRYNPTTRLSARQALCHPFIMRLFPFGLVFSPNVTAKLKIKLESERKHVSDYKVEKKEEIDSQIRSKNSMTVKKLEHKNEKSPMHTPSSKRTDESMQLEYVNDKSYIHSPSSKKTDESTILEGEVDEEISPRVSKVTGHIRSEIVLESLAPGEAGEDDLLDELFLEDT